MRGSREEGPVPRYYWDNIFWGNNGHMSPHSHQHTRGTGLVLLGQVRERLVRMVVLVLVVVAVVESVELRNLVVKETEK